VWVTFALRAKASLISPLKSSMAGRDRLSVGSIPPDIVRTPAVGSFQVCHLQVMGLQQDSRLSVRSRTPYAPSEVMRRGQEQNPLVKTRVKPIAGRLM